MGMSYNVNKYFISVCLYYFCVLVELCVYYSDKYRNVKGFDMNNMITEWRNSLNNNSQNTMIGP